MAGPQEVTDHGDIDAKRLLLSNGGYTATAVLTDAAGNTSDPTTTAFEVHIPPPVAQRLEVTSEIGANPLVIRVPGARFGTATVRLEGDESFQRNLTFGDRSVAGVEFDVPDGHYVVSASVTDFQGQTSPSTDAREVVVKTSEPALALSFDEDRLAIGSLAYLIKVEEGTNVRLSSATAELDDAFVSDGAARQFALEVPNGDHTITVVAVDPFGNEVVKEFTATVTSPLTPLEWSAVLVVLLVLASPFALAVWQRRRIANGIKGATRLLRNRFAR